MTKEKKDVEPDQRDPVEEALDLIDEAEIPEYQSNLQRLVTWAQQDPTLGKLAQGIGPASLRLAFVVIDPRVKRTVTAMTKVAGVDRTTYYQAISNPKWVALRNELAKRFTEDAYTDAMISLRQQLKLGNMKALRLFFELRGDLVQRTENHNINETPEERMKRIRAQEAAKQASSRGDQDGG